MSCKADLGHWYGKIIVDGMDRINVDMLPLFTNNIFIADFYYFYSLVS